jgi:hypothetical protein
MVRSDYVPNLLGGLVGLAGLAYVVGRLGPVLYPDYTDAFLLLIAVLAVPVEFGLVAWLLWKGGKSLPDDDYGLALQAHPASRLS